MMLNKKFSDILPSRTEASGRWWTLGTLLFDCTKLAQQKIWAAELYETIGRCKFGCLLRQNSCCSKKFVEGLLQHFEALNRQLWNCWYWSPEVDKQVTQHHYLPFLVFTQQIWCLSHMLFLFPFFCTTRWRSKGCGFHMIMHAQHWDGRMVTEFNVSSMPNIRKILTHKWLNYEENDTDWKTILNLI